MIPDVAALQILDWFISGN